MKNIFKKEQRTKDKYLQNEKKLIKENEEQIFIIKKVIKRNIYIFQLIQKNYQKRRKKKMNNKKKEQLINLFIN